MACDEYDAKIVPKVITSAAMYWYNENLSELKYVHVTRLFFEDNGTGGHIAEQSTLNIKKMARKKHTERMMM